MSTLYSVTQIGFIATTVVSYSCLLWILHKSLKKTGFESTKQNRIKRTFAAAVVVWMTITGMLAYSGFFQNFTSMPPPFFIVILIPLVVILWVTSTSTLNAILQATPRHHLVYLQSFRIVVEVLLWMLLLDHLIPIQMSFEGRNFDILVGLTALPVGYLLSRGQIGKKSLLIWNICGLCLLLNIVTIAILSTPVSFRVFMNEPANTIVTTFPVVWLPALLVPLAYGLHILSLKQAIQDNLMLRE